MARPFIPNRLALADASDLMERYGEHAGGEAAARAARSRGDASERLRDGIYVLRIDDALVVKRLALHPMRRRVTVQSDNPAYPDWPDCDLDEVNCIGRVIWAGRKID